MIIGESFQSEAYQLGAKRYLQQGKRLQNVKRQFISARVFRFEKEGPSYS